MNEERGLEGEGVGGVVDEKERKGRNSWVVFAVP